MPILFASHMASRLLLAPLLLLAVACGAESPAGDFFIRGDIITVSGSADIVISARVPDRVSAVRPLPAQLTLPRGGVAVFSATANDSAGRFLADVRFEWRMRDPLAGTVTKSGVFTAGSVPGDYSDSIEVIAVQEVEGNEFTTVDTASVVVTTGFLDTSIVSVAVFPSSATARPGERLPMRAAAIGNLGGLVQDLEFFWRVLDPDVGEIDRNGILTVGDKPGLYEGVVEVQARSLGGSGAPVLGRATVRILSDEEASEGVRAIIGPSAVIGRSSARIPLVLLSFDFQGRPVKVEEVVWEVVDPLVGTVDERGRLVLGSVPGPYPGSVRATARLGGAYSGRTVTAQLDVIVQPPLGDILQGAHGVAQIVPGDIRLKRGETLRLSALYFDESGRAVTDETLPWDSDPNVVTVDDRGRVTAVGPPGTYRDAVRATVPGPDGPQTVAASVVILGPLTRVEVVPTRVTMEPGELLQFAGIAFDVADNRLFDVRFRWELEQGVPGEMTPNGFYTAGDEPGPYAGGVRVTAAQREPG